MEKHEIVSQYTQQDDIRHTVWFYEDVDAGTLLDVSSWQFQADLCNSLPSKLMDLSIDVSTLVSSYVNILITNDVTVLLTPGRYGYDLAIRDADNKQLAIYTYIFEILKLRTLWA